MNWDDAASNKERSQFHDVYMMLMQPTFLNRITQRTKVTEGWMGNKAKGFYVFTKLCLCRASKLTLNVFRFVLWFPVVNKNSDNSSRHPQSF